MIYKFFFIYRIYLFAISYNRNSQFDKDFLDFNSRLENIADKMRSKLETCYDCIWDTPHAFQYLQKFKRLSRVVPCGDITAKYERMIGACRAEIDKTFKYFSRHKANPLLPREYPDTPGRVYWVRSLVNKLKYFMDLLDQEEGIRKLRSYKQLVNHYNKVGVSMMQYEIKVEQKFTGPRIRNLESMLAQPVARPLPEGRLELNFDPVLQSFLEENKMLLKLDIKLPSTNKFLISKKDWLFSFKDHVAEIINLFSKASEEIHPDMNKLFSPFQAKLRATLEPTLSDICWTYKDWKEFCRERLTDIETYRDVVKQANDIYSHRLESSLNTISQVQLYALPDGEPWTLDFFMETVKTKCKSAAVQLNTKSRAIEEAVEDIIELAQGEGCRRRGCDEDEDDEEAEYDSLSLADRQHLQTVSSAARELRRNSCKRVIDKLTTLIKSSLRALAKHFERPKETDSDAVKQQLRFDFEDRNPHEDTVFVLDAFLEIPGIQVRPTVEEVQSALSSAGKIIISIAGGVAQWRQIKRKEGNIPGLVPNCDSKKEMKLYNPEKLVTPLIEEKPANFLKVVSESKEVTKSYYLLANSLSKFSLDVVNINNTWSKYSPIWMNEKDEFVKDLISNKPDLAAYENLLVDYKLLKSQMMREEEFYLTGRFKLCTKQLRKTMMKEVDSWISLIARSMLSRYKSEMDHIVNLILDMDIKFDRAIITLDDIRIIMETQKKLREMEIDVEMQINNIQEAFRLATVYDLQMEKIDVETCEALPELWLELLTKGLDLGVMLLTVQEHFQRDLLASLATFQAECDAFCDDYTARGPMQPGLQPREASDKLQIFQNQFDALWRKHGSYSVGEDLFGLDHTEQPGLNSIKKELNLLQRLYKLYNDVIDSVDQYHNILWKDINIEEINNELMEFGNRCRKLPKALKEWPAFYALKKTIDDFNDICPLLELMSNKAMKFRHWQKIQEVMAYKFDMEKVVFSLKDIMAGPITRHKEDIEDICISALKERDIEAKLKQVTCEWSNQEIEFQVFKNRGELLLRGDTTAETVGQAEDSLMILGSLLSNRFNAPFKKQIQKWIKDLSNTSEILERWLLVQNLWVYLEAVFVGGDIAKQLPKEAKRFYKIDKTWQKMMTRAHDMPGVVTCCAGDDYLRHTLPFLQEQLEMCQKSLTGYLEKKRLIFPRFFFVSDPALLEILGQASDTHTIQAHLLSIFDNVATVTFHEQAS